MSVLQLCCWKFSRKETLQQTTFNYKSDYYYYYYYAIGREGSNVPSVINQLMDEEKIRCRQCKKVKASHNRYRALGPQLIPVYRQVTVSHPPGGRLPLLSAKPAVTFPAAEHHRPLAGTNYQVIPVLLGDRGT